MNTEENDKINVQFIDNSNGETIGVTELTAAQLPETFSVSTTMHIGNDDWSVEEAIPENSIDFIKSKSLILKMRKVEKLKTNDIFFSLPTISNEYPLTIATTKHTEYDIEIHEDDYRQNEFLNIGALPLIEKEFAGIKDIWENHSSKKTDYTIFKKCHVRELIGSPDLSINFNKLKTLLNCNDVGQVLIKGRMLENGFVLKTKDTVYFGIVNNDIVTEFCIAQWNENTIGEILEINKTFNLLFVDWCRCYIKKND